MSTASGLLRGSRALLAAARSAAAAAPNPGVSATKKKAAAAAAAAVDAPKPAKALKAPKPKKPTAPSGIMKSKPISLALQDFVGEPEISRVEAVKKVWAYIKLNNLQNPTDKREIFCDGKLKVLFEGKDKVGFLEIGKLLSAHFVKTA